MDMLVWPPPGSTLNKCPVKISLISKDQPVAKYFFGMDHPLLALKELLWSGFDLLWLEGFYNVDNLLLDELPLEFCA